MLGAVEAGGGEAVTEFDATDSWDRENRMGDQGFDRIEKRLSETDGNAIDTAFHDTTNRITFFGGGIQQLRPLGLVHIPTYLGQISFESKPTLLFGDDTSGDKRQSKPSGEMATATWIIETIPLHRSGEISVPRTRNFLKSLIIRGSGITVPEYDRYGSPGGVALIYSAKDFRLVRLDSRSGTLGSTLATEDILHEILLRERHASLDSIDHDTYSLTMGFSEDPHFEVPAESIHIPLS